MAILNMNLGVLVAFIPAWLSGNYIGLDQQSYSMLGLVSTDTGDQLLVGKLATQANSA